MLIGVGPTPIGEPSYLIYQAMEGSTLDAYLHPGVADGFEPSIVRARKRVWVRFANYATHEKTRWGRRRKWIVYSLFRSVL